MYYAISDIGAALLAEKYIALRRNRIDMDQLPSHFLNLGHIKYITHVILSAEKTHTYSKAACFSFRRTFHSMRLSPEGTIERFSDYDDMDFQSRFVSLDKTGLSRTTLLIGGITCAGCIRGIERNLMDLPGLDSVSISSATNRAEISWRRDALPLSKIIAHVFDIGYEAFPFEAHDRQRAIEIERKSTLIRLSLSCLFGMQIMMFTIALYSGDWFGITPKTESFLRWVSLVLSVPLVTYSAYPFYRGAYRSIRTKSLGMDIPVSLAIVIAFFASLSSILHGNGDVYFESIAMFVTLLLASRFFETNARIKASRIYDQYAKAIPNIANRINPEGTIEPIAVSKLMIGDVVVVKVGEISPIDGKIVSGQTAMDESILTGESDAQEKLSGDAVLGGSINLRSTVQIETTKPAENSFVSEISQLTQRAQSLKPRAILLADNIASWFILGVLVIAAFTAWYWLQTDPLRALPVTISVLVICCPCALALATPTAMTVASSAMLKRGVALVNPQVLESLADATCYVFDKTGTLTEGKLSLERVRIAPGGSIGAAKQIASSLARHSEHHVASALIDDSIEQLPVTSFRNHIGRGISGQIGGHTYYLGSADFIAQNAGPSLLDSWPSRHTVTYLASAGKAIACFEFSDQQRKGARALVQFLNERGADLNIMSGDTQETTKRLANDLSINHYNAQLRPQDKLNFLDALMTEGKKVVVVGDGVNDAPMLAKGTASIAVGNATDLTKLSADVVLLNEDLGIIKEAIVISERTKSIIKQNMFWAIGYNSCALPLAMTGIVPPWAAAIGMSISSLIVVLNATRVDYCKDDKLSSPGL